ncbi:MAG: SURF1 family cytochrome oxidase biogenesis protein [Pseudomonadota bacterium]
MPVVIAETLSQSGENLPRTAPAQLELPNNHLSYAITWFGLAFGLMTVFVAYSIRR